MLTVINNATNTALEQDNFSPEVSGFSTVSLFNTDPILLISGLSKGQRKVLDSLILLQSRHKKVWIGNDRLAQVTGYCSMTIQRAAKLLCKLGLIKKVVGGFNKANEYEIHPLFSSISYKGRLSKWLPALKYLAAVFTLSTSLLLSVTGRNVDANSLGDRDILKSSSNSLSITKYAHTRTKGSGTAFSFQETRKRGDLVKQLKEQRMHDAEVAINNIKTLKLTVWGKIVLAAYPKEAIKYADHEIFMRKTPPTNPLGLFKSLCQKFCDTHKIKPSWERVDQLKAKVPWEIGHAEVTSNEVHQNYWANQEALKGTKEYLPGKEWDLKQQHKQIRKPLNFPNTTTIRLPAWTESEDDKKRKDMIATVEIDKAVAAAKEAGKLNPFLAILAESKKPIVSAEPSKIVEPSPFLTVLAPIAERMEKDSLKSIEKVSGNVELYKERKEIPIAWELSAELAQLEEDSNWEEVID